MKPIIQKLGMIVALALSFLPASAYDFESGGIYYTILSEENKTVEVAIENRDYSKHGVVSVEIPSNVVFDGKTYTVTTIGSSAFWNCVDLTSVSIPNSVTVIGRGAFSSCFNLTSVTIGSSVTTIGDSAFYGSALTSVTIPSSVTSIGDRAFGKCSSLVSINVNGNNPNYRSIDGVLYNKDASVIIVCPGGKNSMTIPNTVTTIGKQAFYFCYGLTSVTIPNSVTTIGISAFMGCTGLSSVSIGNSVTTIGDTAFSMCSGMTSVFIPNSVTTLGSRVFNLCSGLTSVTIGSSVSTIGDIVFDGCSSLINIVVDENNQNYSSIDGILYNKDATVLITCAVGKESVIIPNSVTKIEKSAFYFCKSLTSVTIPNSVTTIGTNAFWGCEGLTSVTIPNSVTTIGYEAFRYCRGLTSMIIPNSVTTLNNGAFHDCSGLTTVTIGSSVSSIGNRTFEGCSSLINIFVDENNPNYSSIDGVLYNKDASVLVFHPAKNESLNVPNTVTTIEPNAFSGCSSLTSVTIPNTITTIGANAFANCTGLTSVIIGSSATNNANSAFADRNGLMAVTSRSSDITIGDSAFKGCSNLATLTIGSSVTSIGKNAFANCNSLTTIYSEAITPPAAYDNTFTSTVYEGCKLHIPTGSKADYEAATPWSKFLNIEEMKFSGIDDVASDANAGMQITVVNGAITVSGIADNILITVYNMQGRTVYSGMERTITHLPHGIYIVKVGTSTAKVSL